VHAAREHLTAIASAPRPAGGEAERLAREYCAGVLRALGCDVADHPFEYSTFPGKWGTPLLGVCAAALMIAASNAGASGQRWSALPILLVGSGSIAAIGWWLGRWGVLDLPFARARSTNLAAMRGTPSLWLVAHLDSKSQPIPIGVRASAIIASIVFWIAATALATAQLLGAAPAWLWFPMTALGVIAAIPVAASVVGARSPGALDDASGVATVLRAAELIPRELRIGVLVTSAEELGLAGARAWARTAKPAFALNVDGIDDVGSVRLIYSGAPPHGLLMSIPRDSGWPAPERIPPGLLLDGVALADAGFSVLTVSKGSWKTVARIHTAGDDVDHLGGSGIENVAVSLAEWIVAQARLGGDLRP
jgi:hypothetical protein